MAVTRFDGVYVLGKELRRDPERAVRELRARSAAASVALRRGAAGVLALEAALRGQREAGSAIVAGFLAELGVPADRVVSADLTRSTREEALLGSAEADRRGWARLLVLTSAYHAERARRLFEEVRGPGRVAVFTPEAFLRGATPREREWILAGTPDAATLRAEARVEAVFGALAAVLGPLPAPFRWEVEVRAGALLRRTDLSPRSRR